MRASAPHRRNLSPQSAATDLRKQAEAIRAEPGDVRITGFDQRKINLTDPQERQF